ncbi:hypothetical protein HGRIS_009471 [Hohenbuehelia grisea]|uniref:ER membrane protein complex subunit 10 n=1 Tax=Hohenbuehelia grisea TaxID=104357 RepID=A0ABR3J197_9AGAR
MLSFLLILTAASLVAASEFRVSHRVYHPNAQKRPNYVYRGSLNTHPIPTFHHADDAAAGLTQFADFLKTEGLSAEDALYQVALEADTDQELWQTSSVKLCHLQQLKSETLILHATESHNSVPYALDYFVAPVLSDGSCPPLEQNSPSPFHVFATKLSQLNTTVTVRNARLPPLPELRVPPPLNEAGEPVKPPPEKSFIQKYWMYIVPVLLALLLTGGPEEAPPRGN